MFEKFVSKIRQKWRQRTQHFVVFLDVWNICNVLQKLHLLLLGHGNGKPASLFFFFLARNGMQLENTPAKSMRFCDIHKPRTRVCRRQRLLTTHAAAL